MTQLFQEDGQVVPVTVLEVGPCTVLRVKTPETDGYAALQVGYLDTKEKRLTKPLRGVFARAGVPPKKVIRELPPIPGAEYKTGDEIKVDIFEGVEKVNVVGTTKGRGFAGTIKRWNFHSGPRSHGCKNVREIGSTGPCFPSRVMPGKRMPGHYGVERVKLLNLKVVRVDPERNLLLVKGAVPGPSGGLVYVEESLRG